MPPYSRQRSGPCPEFFHIAQNVACELQYSPGTLRHQSRQKRYRMREVRPCLAGEPKQLPHDLLAPFHISRVSGLFRFDHAVNLWKEISGLKRNHSAPQTLPTGRAGVKFLAVGAARYRTSTSDFKSPIPPRSMPILLLHCLGSIPQQLLVRCRGCHPLR